MKRNDLLRDQHFLRESFRPIGLNAGEEFTNEENFAPATEGSYF